MKEKPILFSTPMVRAILEERKTMTRRSVKPQPDSNGAYVVPKILGQEEIWDHWCWDTEEGERIIKKCPYGEVGDILWVRETWMPLINSEYGKYGFKADLKEPHKSLKWKPSIFMPKEACRLWLEVTEVSVERLNSISWDDAVAEGCPGYRPIQDEPTMQFERLWESINGKGSWAKNPWVWVIKFKKIAKP